METLKPLMDEILEVKADMAIEPNDADARVRSGVEARVRNATAKLPTLETKYRDQIKNHVVLIGVVGEGAKEFANIAKYVFKTAIADHNTLNNRLQLNFANRSARMDWNNQESYMLLDELAKLKHEFAIYTLPNPSFNIGNINLQGENTFKVIDQVLKHNYGHQLHTIALLNDIFKSALSSHFGGKLLPVIVYSDSATEDTLVIDEAVLPKLHSVFTVSLPVTDDTVKAVLEDVKKSLNVKPSQPVVVETPSIETKIEVVSTPTEEVATVTDAAPEETVVVEPKVEVKVEKKLAGNKAKR
jgi:hypothetical protein